MSKGEVEEAAGEAGGTRGQEGRGGSTAPSAAPAPATRIGAAAGLAAPLVAPGGYLVLCSCSHAADLTAFRNVSARGIGRGGRRGVLIHTGQAGPDHPTLPQLAETGYLKALFFRLD